MALHGYSGHKLEELCGVPAGTTYRFLRGAHEEPKGDTIKRWAEAFGITEGQLRGHVPLSPKLAAKLAAVPPLDLMVPRLTDEEKEVVMVLRGIRKESRLPWIKIGKALTNNAGWGECPEIGESPTEEEAPPQLPLGIEEERRAKHPLRRQDDPKRKPINGQGNAKQRVRLEPVHSRQ